MADLPEAVYEGVETATDLRRHLGFIDLRLSEGLPERCAQDPLDIVKRDLPGALELFDEWYEGLSQDNGRLSSRLEPYIERGELNAAAREAWAVFKSRMVERFGLSDAPDGHPLADSLFGSNGATEDLLSKQNREGYLHLFKGLYTLYRNPVIHNDIRANPEEVDAVLALVNSALMNLEETSRQRPAVEEELA